MATRSHTTFKKRQKEMARVEKRLEKAAKRLKRKEEDGQNLSAETPEEAAVTPSSTDVTV